MARYKNSLLKPNQNTFQDRSKMSPESPVSMDQSAKDTRDTSDHKCILIWNPGYKYKLLEVFEIWRV